MSTTLLPPPPTMPVAPVATHGGDARAHVAQTGVWIAIATISMTFAALTSALVVRQSGAPDWQHFQLPSLLYANTLVLLVSSVTLEASRRRRTAAGLNTTIVLGFLFIAGQALAWRQLVAQRLVLASGPSSAFFYLFTVLHALHVLGGITGLLYVHRRLAWVAWPAPALNAAALYWHFMALLWVYLLVLLTIRG